MAVNTAYATAQQYREATGKTDKAQDAEITTDLTAISRYLDGKLGRFFSQDMEPVTRTYIPDTYTDGLWVDDLAEPPVIIKIDTRRNGKYETELDASDYELLPLNADKGPEPRPFTRIQLTFWGSYACFTPRERVQVTARYGWPEIPEAIQRATIHLTAILRLESPRATRRIAEIGETIEASMDAQIIIRQLTDQYKVWRL